MAVDSNSSTALVRTSRGGALTVLLPLGGFIVALLIVEVLFRVLMSGAKPKPHPTDIPHINYIPEQAFLTRDFYYPPEKPKGAFRIIVLGDSFTFGGKVHFDDTFPKRLERMLNLNQTGRKVEVLNWGVPGYSTAHEVQLFKDAVAKFHPDLIVVEITLNDAEMTPYKVTRSFQNKDGTIRLRNPIFRYWKSLAFVVTRVCNSMLHRDYINYHLNMFNNPDNWGRFTSSWKEMRELSDSRSVPVLAAIFPMLSHPLDDSYPFHSIHEKISQELDERGIPAVDMFHDFEGRDPVRLQVEPGRDGHPNELAHRIAADSIYVALNDKQLIPDDVKIKRFMKKRVLRPSAIKDAHVTSGEPATQSAGKDNRSS